MELLSTKSYGKGRSEVEKLLKPQIEQLQARIAELEANPTAGNERPADPATAGKSGSKADEKPGFPDPFQETVHKTIQELRSEIADLKKEREEDRKEKQASDQRLQRMNMTEKVKSYLRDHHKLNQVDIAFLAIQDHAGVTFVPNATGDDYLAVLTKDPTQSVKPGEYVFLKSFLDDWVANSPDAKIFKSPLTKSSNGEREPDLPPAKRGRERRIGVPYDPKDPAMRKALEARGILG